MPTDTDHTTATVDDDPDIGLVFGYCPVCGKANSWWGCEECGIKRDEAEDDY